MIFLFALAGLAVGAAVKAAIDYSNEQKAIADNRHRELSSEEEAYEQILEDLRDDD